MKPLLAHVYEPHRVTYPCYCQPKLNGIRALYQNGRFQSRDEQPFSASLLRHLAEPLLATFDPSVILDGELYVHGWPLQRINGAVTPVRNEPNEDTVKVEYHVFDVVDFNRSFEVRYSSILDQRQIKLGLIKSEEFVSPTKGVDTYIATNEESANKYYSAFVSLGYEGMMYRLGDCPYTLPKQEMPDLDCRYPGLKRRRGFLSDKDNRCWHLLKRKSWQDGEFEIVGVVEGEGRLAGMLGAITCKTDSETFQVGSGFSDADRLKFWEYPMLAIGHQAKVKFLCLSEAGIPLNPTLLAIL